MNEARKAQPFDAVERPKHYNLHPSGVEAIELCELLPFNLGNALKYVWRAGEKDDRKQDLGKALWYAKRHYSQMIRKDYPDFDLGAGYELEQSVETLVERIVIAERSDTLLAQFLRCLLAENFAGCMASIEVELVRLG